MNQFARIQGASSQETFWFSKSCNAVAGQIDSYLLDDETAAICRVKALERATSPSGKLFGAYFCGFNAILILFMSP